MNSLYVVIYENPFPQAHTTMRSNRDFFIGTLTGIAIGLLVAPRPGEESRRRLKQEYDKRMGSSSGSSGPDLQERLTTLFDQVKEQINNYIGQRNNHKKRMADTGHFDYQLERPRKFAQQGSSSPAGSSTTGES